MGDTDRGIHTHPDQFLGHLPVCGKLSADGHWNSLAVTILHCHLNHPQNGRMTGAAQMRHPGILTVRRHGVLCQIIGSNAEKNPLSSASKSLIITAAAFRS